MLDLTPLLRPFSGPKILGAKEVLGVSMARIKHGAGHDPFLLAVDQPFFFGVRRRLQVWSLGVVGFRDFMSGCGLLFPFAKFIPG